MDGQAGDYGHEPDLIPARMLNEFVYCPRLFYLEWVDRLWADSADTVRGHAAHDANDKRGGRMPPPDNSDPPRATTQVEISDLELGVIAVIDRVDHSDGSTTPVDIKKGRAPKEGVWPADRIQVLTQAVLLRRAGYRVAQAEVSYLGSRAKVAVKVDDDAEVEVAGVVAAARHTAKSVAAPLPLVNDARCPRCSLVGLCLPDETNALLERSPDRPRSIVPRDPDAQPVYVSTPGAVVKVSGLRLKVEAEGQVLADVRLVDVSQLCVIGNVQITTQALSALWRAGAVVLWLGQGGWFNGWSQGPPGKHVELRRRQVIAHAQGVSLAAEMIRGKIHNQRTLLRRNAKTGLPETVTASLRSLASAAREATTIPELLGIEGTAARIYFENFDRMIVPSLPFGSEFLSHGRARRPPPDPVNAVLGFCYALLTKDLVATLVGVGLDPYLGVLHRSRYGRPALALDLAEEFRALIAESVTVQCFNNGELREQHFVRHPLGVRLTPDGRRAVIAAYERRMGDQLTHPTFGYRLTYRRVLDVQARVLAAVMLGEIPQYVPVMTR
ncbi:MAG: CRISPR-associated endonuclease Cas1 [Actinomycetales bacterium]|nr:CRISPR-associated endonuclease Cas1 [Candidatus Phosphoribacter baldrii]